ncbi:DUF6973 domain-containing protein [Caloramator sp. Dgby_cultured_2]|uniref:DUF6973 domain-containing protein n=1 Tax=Caloramator sp. Dgby_cultured_2 TaxID=3029174 RepID=UPI00237DDFCF|nr:hypothetical protein [Caloramator sp. Dgby_cultured_2]WDU82771.1 hypothetical protein PWK10_14750 [Caloramator sp. Dgby_cultured_2]
MYNNENILYDNINGLSYPAPVSLNPKEQELYNKNPFKGLKAIWQGKKAMDETEKRYSEGLHNGNGDAFRHAYWNAMMVKHIDYNWALDWATAHEEGAVGQPSIEKEMDLYNNEVGRKAVLGKESKSDTEIADIIQGMVRNGKMKRIVNNKLVNTNSEGERK